MTAVCLELLNTCRSQGKRKQEKRQQPQLAVAGVNSAAVNQPGPGRADRCRARFEAAGRAHVAVRARAYDRCGEPGGEPAGRPGVIKRRRTSPAAFAFGQGIITLLTHMVITLWVCLVPTKFPNFSSHPSHLLSHRNIKYNK